MGSENRSQNDVEGVWSRSGEALDFGLRCLPALGLRGSRIYRAHPALGHPSLGLPIYNFIYNGIYVYIYIYLIYNCGRRDFWDFGFWREIVTRVADRRSARGGRQAEEMEGQAEGGGRQAEGSRRQAEGGRRQVEGATR